MSPLALDGYLTGIVVTPQPIPILPERWIAHLWDDEPVFDDGLQIELVLGPVINHYNALKAEIESQPEAHRKVHKQHRRLSAAFL